MAKILIVDDEPRNRRLLELIVVSEGHEARHAENGAEALALVAADPPDLILLDLMMPEMDGFQVVRSLKESDRTRAIPVVVVTALDEPAARQRVVASGADDFVGKPLDRWELLLRLQRLLPRGAPDSARADSARPPRDGA